MPPDPPDRKRDRRAGNLNGFGLALLALVPVALGVLLYLLYVGDGDDPGPQHELNANLCIAGSEPTGRAVLLLDLRKPMPRTDATVREMLRDVSMDLNANAELRVFAVTDDPTKPREALERFCKPYDNRELEAARADDQSGGRPDCDDLPAELAPHVRENASRFCARRAALADRVRRRLTPPPGDVAPLANAYLIEAIEDTGLEFADLPGPHALYVLSDMMQHTRWYSHLEVGWSGWNHAEFTRLRNEHAQPVPTKPRLDGLDVDVFYVPRKDTTEHPRMEVAHKRFWQDYFDEFGTVGVRFRDQPVMPEYPIEPLMDRLTDSELAALERRQLEREREESERVLARIEREKAALAQAQQEAETRHRAAEEELARRLAAEEEAARQRVAEAEAASRQRERQLIAQREAERRAPEAGAEGAEEGSSSATCTAQLKPQFHAANADLYPEGRRVNYGSAAIVVRFTVDENGETVNVAVSDDGSYADRPNNLGVFTETALNAVRNWQYDFTQSSGCQRRHDRAVRLQFDYRR